MCCTQSVKLNLVIGKMVSETVLEFMKHNHKAVTNTLEWVTQTENKYHATSRHGYPIFVIVEEDFIEVKIGVPKYHYLFGADIFVDHEDTNYMTISRGELRDSFWWLCGRTELGADEDGKTITSDICINEAPCLAESIFRIDLEVLRKVVYP